MSDIKKFTGFIANIDGSAHATEKAALEHSRNLKAKIALEGNFGALAVAGNLNGNEVGLPLSDFILQNQALIMNCLNPEVLTRKKRAPRAATETLTGEKPKRARRSVSVAVTAPVDAVTSVAVSEPPAPAPAAAPATTAPAEASAEMISLEAILDLC